MAPEGDQKNVPHAIEGVKMEGEGISNLAPRKKINEARGKKWLKKVSPPIRFEKDIIKLTAARAPAMKKATRFSALRAH